MNVRLCAARSAAAPPNTASFRVMERLGMRFAEQRVLGGLEAIYYCIDRAEFQRAAAR